MLVSVIILMILLFVSSNAKMITFKTSCIQKKPLPTNFMDFIAWFASDRTPDRILGLNPGLTRVEQLENDGKRAINNSPSIIYYRGYVTPLQFPGLLVSSVIDFDVEQIGSCLTIECREDAIQMKYEGNAALAKMVSVIQPTVTSRSIIKVDELNKELLNEASLAISFPLPDWFPLGQGMIESSGSAIIEKNIVTDMKKLLDNITQEYENTL